MPQRHPIWNPILMYATTAYIVSMRPQLWGLILRWQGRQLHRRVTLIEFLGGSTSWKQAYLCSLGLRSILICKKKKSIKRLQRIHCHQAEDSGVKMENLEHKVQSPVYKILLDLNQKSQCLAKRFSMGNQRPSIDLRCKGEDKHRISRRQCQTEKC